MGGRPEPFESIADVRAEYGKIQFIPPPLHPPAVFAHTIPPKRWKMQDDRLQHAFTCSLWLDIAAIRPTRFTSIDHALPICLVPYNEGPNNNLSEKNVMSRTIKHETLEEIPTF